VSFLAMGSGAKTPAPGLTEIDKKAAENMMAIWAQFARTGNPNVKGLVTWPAYDSATDQYLYMADSLQVKSGFSKIAASHLSSSTTLRVPLRQCRQEWN
jgi:carboxylesterase type B